MLMLLYARPDQNMPKARPVMVRLVEIIQSVRLYALDVAESVTGEKCCLQLRRGADLAEAAVCVEHIENEVEDELPQYGI